MTEDCKDFISKLLEKNPVDRLGAKNDVQDLLQHPWFSDLDVKKMENREYEHKFVPEISDNILDTQNFDPDIDKNEIRFSTIP